jgi:hypothetical protein
MPVLNLIICKLLGQSMGSYGPEKVFSRGKFVLNPYRTSLLADRAEQSILSSMRYHMQLFSASLPHLPDIGIELSRDDAVALDDQMEADEVVVVPPEMVDEDEEGADGDEDGDVLNNDA